MLCSCLLLSLVVDVPRLVFVCVVLFECVVFMLVVDCLCSPCFLMFVVLVFVYVVCLGLFLFCVVVCLCCVLVNCGWLLVVFSPGLDSFMLCFCLCCV